MVKIIVVKNKKTAGDLYKNMNRGNTLVLYHAHWCGHCQRFQPDWQKLKRKLKSEMPNVCLGEVEQTPLQQHMKNVSVQGFPTIKFYKRGKSPNNNNEENTNSIPFDGERNMENLINFIKINMEKGNASRQSKNTAGKSKNNKNTKKVIITEKVNSPSKLSLKNSISMRLQNLFSTLTKSNTRSQHSQQQKQKSKSKSVRGKKMSGKQMLKQIRRTMKKKSRSA